MSAAHPLPASNKGRSGDSRPSSLEEAAAVVGSDDATCAGIETVDYNSTTPGPDPFGSGGGGATLHSSFIYPFLSRGAASIARVNFRRGCGKRSSLSGHRVW